MRIALIHALKHSPAPIKAAFRALWPQPTLMNLLDDSLSADLARDGALTPQMTQRFLNLAHYAVGTGAQAILFTCSAFGPCIDAVKAQHPHMPVLKPNEAMIEEATIGEGMALGTKAQSKTGTPHIGLMATFAPTLASMPPEFPASVILAPKLIAGAMAALDAGDTATHDDLAVRAALELVSQQHAAGNKPLDAIALAQFSLARAADAIEAATGIKVLTTPGSAVRKLRAMLG
jgi:hypothetical protein